MGGFSLMDNYEQAISEFVERHSPRAGLEVGMWKGLSAGAYLGSTSGTLLSLDLNDEHGTGERLSEKYPGRFIYQLGDSSTSLKSLIERDKEFYDYIYIDGDHTYKGCKKDLIAAIPLLKKDGVILIDDYGLDGGAFAGTSEADTGSYGIKKAVDEVLGGWKRIDKDIKFNNGAVAFKK